MRGSAECEMEKIEKLGGYQTRGDSLWDKAGIISCYTPARYNAGPAVKYFPLRWPGDVSDFTEEE